MADSAAPPKSWMGLLPSLQTPGFRLVDAGELYQFLNGIFGVHTTNNAAATSPILLPAGINVVAAAGATGVQLPPANLPGQIMTVVNNTAAVLDVVGQGLTAATIAAGGNQQYLCTAIGTWTPMT
jgi:hypothetical protein